VAARKGSLAFTEGEPVFVIEEYRSQALGKVLTAFLRAILISGNTYVPQSWTAVKALTKL